MVATLTFLGAAGSKFLLEQDGHRTLVDCGLYQGERTWRRLNWQALAVNPNSIPDVVLTHAHLDNCGHLPALVREGFTGPISRWRCVCGPMMAMRKSPGSWSGALGRWPGGGGRGGCRRRVR